MDLRTFISSMHVFSRLLSEKFLIELFTCLNTSHSFLTAYQLLSFSGSLSRPPSGFPGSSVVKNSCAKAGDMGSIPDPGRSQMLRSNWVHAPHYWACDLKSRSHNFWSPCSTREATAVRSPHSATEEQTLLTTRENPREAAKTWPSNASTKWHWTCRKGGRQAKSAERGEESPD